MNTMRQVTQAMATIVVMAMGLKPILMMQTEEFLDKPVYIQSKPPTGGYLYHHSTYTALREIAVCWGIRPSKGKFIVSLTTDLGRYLSPLPFIVAVTVDGVVRIPYDAEIAEKTVPALYHTTSKRLIKIVESRGYTVFEEPPPEYRYIKKWVTHSAMFIEENEYAYVGEGLGLPEGSEIFIHPRKLKRFQAGLARFAMPVRSLEEIRE